MLVVFEILFVVLAVLMIGDFTSLVVSIHYRDKVEGKQKLGEKMVNCTIIAFYVLLHILLLLSLLTIVLYC